MLAPAPQSKRFVRGSREDFRVEAIAQTEFEAPIASVEGAVVRREFVERFPYVVVFVETNEERRVIMIRRGSSDPARWRSRV